MESVKRPTCTQSHYGRTPGNKTAGVYEVCVAHTAVTASAFAVAFFAPSEPLSPYYAYDTSVVRVAKEIQFLLLPEDWY